MNCSLPRKKWKENILRGKTKAQESISFNIHCAYISRKNSNIIHIFLYKTILFNSHFFFGLERFPSVSWTSRTMLGKNFLNIPSRFLNLYKVTFSKYWIILNNSYIIEYRFIDRIDPRKFTRQISSSSLHILLTWNSHLIFCALLNYVNAESSVLRCVKAIGEGNE